MLKKIGRSQFARSALGALATKYLKLVRSTTRFVTEPADFPQRIAQELPVIAAMWHGQHFMIHFAWPQGADVSALISRHGDGEINAQILSRLGVRAIRGSGGDPAKMQKRGGAVALREMLRALEQGSTMVLTADIPKVSRRAGAGIVTLARMSGRPIYPIAVVSGRRVDFNSWDRASLALPFGRGAMVLGDPVHVARDASDAELEAARQAVQDGLDAVHARAYALVGAKDPGARPIETSGVGA